MMTLFDPPTERDEDFFRIGYLSAWKEVTDLAASAAVDDTPMEVLVMLAWLADTAVTRMGTPPSAAEKISLDGPRSR